jgi:hypothetical protein
MKTEINIEQAIGKTLVAYAFSEDSGQAVLVFTDNTFSTLGVSTGYEIGYEHIIEDKLNPEKFGDTLLIKANIYSEEELAIMWDKLDEIDKANEEASERKAYERLRRKFENQ